MKSFDKLIQIDLLGLMRPDWRILEVNLIPNNIPGLGRSDGCWSLKEGLFHS